MSETFDLDNYYVERRTIVDKALDDLLPAPKSPDRDPCRLREGMRYAVLLGGKRMRPLMTIAACEAAGGSIADALPAGCAIELIHAYSLVHDDLPAMDNDVERRGKPTVHVAFGHANAILVGDALLTEAFRVLARGVEGASRANIGESVAILSKHAGIDGMVGGQALDLVAGQSLDSLERLEGVHALKTGGLYSAAGALGALAARASSDQVARLERYGLAFGIAFQHADDILDDDQQALRERALGRIDQLAEECRTIAAEFGSRATALTAVADWVQARGRRAAAGDRRD